MGVFMNNKPVVKLIAKPDNMLKTIYTACRTCYSAEYPADIYENAVDNDKMLKLIERVISSGHYSTVEHIQVTFAISNVSRACTHQLVRHRHMSFSQKSQRYVKEKGQFDYIIPPTIEKNPELKSKFENFMNEISKQYQEFVEAGIPAEDRPHRARTAARRRCVQTSRPPRFPAGLPASRPAPGFPQYFAA